MNSRRPSEAKESIAGGAASTEPSPEKPSKPVKPLFDAEWYARQYHLSFPSDVEALQHYLGFGTEQNFNPSPNFDTRYYKLAAKEAVGSGHHPFLHYLLHGRAAGKSPKPIKGKAGGPSPLDVDGIYLPDGLQLPFSPACPNQKWEAPLVCLYSSLSVQPEALPSICELKQELEWAAAYGIAAFCFDLCRMTGSDGAPELFGTPACPIRFCLQINSGSDPEPLLGELSRFLTHPGYFKLGNRPLIILRPAGADPNAEAERWQAQLTGFDELAILTLPENVGEEKPGRLVRVMRPAREYHNRLLDALSAAPLIVDAWRAAEGRPGLKPDAEHGFTLLDATRTALARASLMNPGPLPAGGRLAVVIHAFYPDVLAGALETLAQVANLAFDLYVTSPPEKAAVVEDQLRASGFLFTLRPVENRGRDVLPFLKIFPEIKASGHRLILKLHTKKSPHLARGDQWRLRLFEDLLNAETIATTVAAFEADPTLGIVGPGTSMLWLRTSWGFNLVSAMELAARLGFHWKDLLTMRFAAGTMFFIRTEVVELISMLVREEDFEQELAQTDGTIAHALERFFPVAAAALGLGLTDTITLKNPHPEAATPAFVPL